MVSCVLPQNCAGTDASPAEDSRSAVNAALEALRSLSEPASESTSLGTSFARQDQKIEILNGLIQVRSV